MARSGTFEIDKTRAKAAQAIAPLKPANEHSAAPKDMLFSAGKTKASQMLPEPYFVYFLLVDLLGYRNLGRCEKLAYSIPVHLNGTDYFVEHRKFGLGVFSADPATQKDGAKEIVRLINRAVRTARPYFEYLANQVAEGSDLNVANYSRSLYERFEYLLRLYRAKAHEAETRKDERIVERKTDEQGRFKSGSIRIPARKLEREARWLGFAALEAFFSWTEHIFIHIAVLSGVCTTGKEVSDLAGARWAEKYKTALSIDEPETKVVYDELTLIHRQLRNYVSHGAFGKDRQAFSFHSSAGAVPLLLPHSRNGELFRFGSGVDLDPALAFDAIERFPSHLWSGQRSGMELYIQESDLPSILSMSADGTYARARAKDQDMLDLTKRLMMAQQDAWNMDW